MKSSTTGATIGGLSGGLLVYYLTRHQSWATIKKVAAVAGGVVGGGVIGWGIGKIPQQETGFHGIGSSYSDRDLVLFH